MPLNAIVDLFVGLRRDETAVCHDDKAHKEIHPPLPTAQQTDASAIALMTAHANGLIC